MNSENSKPAETYRRSGDEPKTRKCLRCRAAFPSEWSGERICKRCKSANSWRNGLASTFERRGSR